MSLRFGIFEFDSASLLLRRGGVHVRLQAQPAQVLRLLLENAGQVVTRVELKEAVWGSDTFVDFDKGLNFCIAQIRSALGESAESPIYIKTVPKLGYQFIAAVNSDEKNRSKADEVVAPPLLSARSKSFRIAGLAMLVILFAGLFVWVRHVWIIRRSDTTTVPAIRVAVARFDNETGDANFDRITDALSDSVTAKLTISSSGRYGVIGNAAILRLPRSQRDLTAIGSTLSAGYVVLAQLRRDTSHSYLLAHLIHLPDQTHIAVTELTCTPSASLANQSQIAQQIADKFSPLIANQVTAGSPHKTL